MKVSVPVDLLAAPEEWGGTAVLYGLDSRTIGVAPSWVKEWMPHAWRIEIVPLDRESDGTSFVMPESFREFYDLPERRLVTSVIGNICLLVVENAAVKGKRSQSQHQ